jgi:hypothetical protein
MKVKSRVRSVTYATVGALGCASPTPDEKTLLDPYPAAAAGERLRPVVATLNKFEERRVSRVVLDAWRPLPPSSPPSSPSSPPSSPSRGGQRFDMEATVLVPVTSAALLAPTFHTLWVARRYSVALRVDVRAPGGRGVRLRLGVPLQVVYPEAPPPPLVERGIGGRGWGCEEGSLPVYIP